jgi:hypothetical protein
MQHLRGVAPQMSPYRRSPFPAFYRPILTGLWPPSRSFDRGIAPVADASRTLCAGIPANRNPCSVAAALVVPHRLEACGERASLRSAPASSSLTVQPFGWGSLRRPWWRGVRRNVCREASVVTAMKQVSRKHCCLREGVSFGVFEVPSTLGPSDAGIFRCPCSDPVRIRQTHLAAHLRGCRPPLLSETHPPKAGSGHPPKAGSGEWPRPTFNTGWVTRVNWMVERSDRSLSSLRSNIAFHDARPWLATVADDAPEESVRSGSCAVSCRRDGFSRSIASSPCACLCGCPPSRLTAKGSRPTSLGFLTSKIARR